MADLFELVADTVPDRECLVSGKRRLTYRELDERANRLAHHLADQGLVPAVYSVKSANGQRARGRQAQFF